MRKFLNNLFTLVLGISFLSACTILEDDVASDDIIKYGGKFSTSISLEAAISDLNSLLLDIDNVSSRTGAPARVIKNAYTVNISPSLSRSEQSDTILIYIINFENNRGYAIMSGDERIPSLIAFSEQGSLHKDDVLDNPGLLIFFEGMDSLRDLEEEGGGDIGGPTGTIVGGNSGLSGHTEYGDWKNTVYFQNGLCPVKWGQEDPYNNYCQDNKGNRALTGCVATAVAQLMSVYKYPSSYNGYSFNWDAMSSFPYATDFCVTSETKDNIARLMQQLGLKKNLDVNYGVTGSSADSKNAIRTLKAFGYSNGGQLKKYDTQSVISDLKQGYPVLIRGNSFKKEYKLLNFVTIYTKYSGGHVWLAHGLLERKREVRRCDAFGKVISTYYQTEWYPQCNWGWDGMSDGYYLSGAFDALNGPEYPDTDANETNSGENYNYQYNVEAITGIRK